MPTAFSSRRADYLGLAASFPFVIAGFDPAIHSVPLATGLAVTEWMLGSSPGMTTVGVKGHLLQSGSGLL